MFGLIDHGDGLPTTGYVRLSDLKIEAGGSSATRASRRGTAVRLHQGLITEQFNERAVAGQGQG
jgi:hypothetical protein